MGDRGEYLIEYRAGKQVIQDRISGRQVADADEYLIEYLVGRQVIQDRISGRQVADADEYLIEYLVGRQVIQDRMSDRQVGGAGVISSNISCTTHLPTRYSILNHLPAPRIQCFFAWKCTGDIVLFCLEMHRGFNAFLP